MKFIVVWYNPKKNNYYYKVVNNFFDKYYIGYSNQYGHKIVLIIDIYKQIIYKQPLLKKVLRRVISFLHKIYKRM